MALLAAAAGLVTARTVAAADATVERWGRATTAFVVLTGLATGATVGPGDVATRSLPEGAVPGNAVASDPVGRVAAVDLYAGEVLIDDRLAPLGVAGAAAVLPPGTVGLAVPDPGGLPLLIGDLVDVLATFDPDTAGAGDPTVVVARAARVVATDADNTGAVTIAVSDDEAPRVAFAITAGLVTLALRSPR